MRILRGGSSRLALRPISLWRRGRNETAGFNALQRKKYVSQWTRIQKGTRRAVRRFFIWNNTRSDKIYSNSKAPV